MPIYEYYCQDCATKFQKLMSISRMHEQPPCPECSGGHTEKLLSTFAAIRGGSSDASSYDGGGSSSGGGCAGCSGGNCGSCH